MTTSWVSNGGQKEDNTVLTTSQWWVVAHSVSAWRQSQRGWNLCGHIVSVHDGNHKVDGIFVGLSWELQCWQQSDRVLKQWWTTGREKGSEPHHQSEFLCNYYTLSECRQQYRQCGQSLHRPFQQAVRFHCLFNCFLHYIMEHNFPLPGL